MLPYNHSGDGDEHVTINKNQKYRQGTQLNSVSVLGVKH